jgi:hypothetical protein
MCQNWSDRYGAMCGDFFLQYVEIVHDFSLLFIQYNHSVYRYMYIIHKTHLSLISVKHPVMFILFKICHLHIMVCKKFKHPNYTYYKWKLKKEERQMCKSFCFVHVIAVTCRKTFAKWGHFGDRQMSKKREEIRFLKKIIIPRFKSVSLVAVSNHRFFSVRYGTAIIFNDSTQWGW